MTKPSKARGPQPPPSRAAVRRHRRPSPLIRVMVVPSRAEDDAPPSWIDRFKAALPVLSAVGAAFTFVALTLPAEWLSVQASAALAAVRADVSSSIGVFEVVPRSADGSRRHVINGVVSMTNRGTHRLGVRCSAVEIHVFSPEPGVVIDPNQVELWRDEAAARSLRSGSTVPRHSRAPGTDYFSEIATVDGDCRSETPLAATYLQEESYGSARRWLVRTPASAWSGGRAVMVAVAWLVTWRDDPLIGFAGISQNAPPGSPPQPHRHWRLFETYLINAAGTEDHDANGIDDGDE